jgi:hypothetical protein
MTITHETKQYSVDYIVTSMDKGRINVDPPYQRREVWSTRKGLREGLIKSILRGCPILGIILHKKDEGFVQDVVDGKNRLIAIRDYVQNKYTVWGLLYEDLTEVVKSRFDNYGLSITTLESTWSRDEVTQFFENLQGGLNLSIGEIIKGSCHPLAAVMCELNEEPTIKDFFIRIIGEKSETRSQALTKMIIIIQTYDSLKAENGVILDIHYNSIDTILSKIPHDLIEREADSIKVFVRKVVSEASELYSNEKLSPIFYSAESRRSGSKPLTVKKYMTKVHLFDVAYMVGMGFDCKEVYQYSVDSRGSDENAEAIFAPASRVNNVTKRETDDREKALFLIQNTIQRRKRAREGLFNVIRHERARNP